MDGLNAIMIEMFSYERIYIFSILVSKHSCSLGVSLQVSGLCPDMILYPPPLWGWEYKILIYVW